MGQFKKISKARIINLRDSLVSVREKLNEKLSIEDLKEFKQQDCGEIMNLFDRFSKVLDDYHVPYFGEAIGLINYILAEVITENIGQNTGISYVMHVYELLENAVDDLIQGKGVLENFEEALNKLEGLVAGVDSTGEVVKKELIVEEEIIQDTPPQDVVDDGLVSEFVNEALEGLEQVEEGLLELEQAPDQSELIDQIFRTMHTIKGTSSFLGMPVIGKISHQTEDILTEVRNGKREVDAALIDLFFASLDTLKNLINQIKDLIDSTAALPVNVTPFYQKLNSCLGKEKQKVPVHENRKTLPEPETAPVDKEGSVDQSKSDGIIENEESINKASGGSVDEMELLLEESGPEDEEALPEVFNKDRSTTKEDEVMAQKKRSRFKEMLKVPAENLDELSGLVGEMVVALSLLTQNPVVAGINDRSVHKQLDQLVKTTEGLRDKVLGIRMFPIGTVFSKLSRQVRDLSKKSGKKIDLKISGEDTLVDKTIIDNIYAPLMHIVRNSIDHGLETSAERKERDKPEKGVVSLDAQHMGDSILLKIEDDGKGLNAEKILKKATDRGLTKGRENLTNEEIYSFIFLPGFSTAKKVTDISGRGVGLDVVKRTIENLRGKMLIDSTPNKGTSFMLKLPLTTSIIEGLVVRVGQTRFILPILDVNQTVTPKEEMLQGAQGYENNFFLLAGELIPIVPIYQIYKIPTEVVDPAQSVIVVVNDGKRKYGIMVDDLLHRQQIVIQSMGTRFEELQGISGGTILGDGRIGFIIDPISLIHNLYSVTHNADSGCDS